MTQRMNLLKRSLTMQWLSRTLSTSVKTNVNYSYSHTPSKFPMLGETFGQRLEWAVNRVPERDAFVFPKLNVRLSFAQYMQKADTVAAGLRSMGVKRGSHVGLWGVNTPEWVLSHAGSLRAGAMLANLHPGYRPAEIEYTLNLAEISVLLVNRTWRSQDYLKILRGLAPELDTLPPRPGPLQLKRLPHLRHIVVFNGAPEKGMHLFEDFAATASPEQVRAVRDLQRDIQMDDPAQMMFTSGTTGNPKAAVLSHFNILNNNYFVYLRLGLFDSNPPSRVCCPLPFYHTFSNTGIVHASAVSLTTLVCPAEFFNAEDTLRAVQAEKCNVIHATPTMFIDMLHHPRLADFDLSSLRAGVAGGAPMPHAVALQVAEKLHIPEIMVGYGQTEGTCASHLNYPTNSLEIRTSTVGRELDHTESKIIDEEGRIVPRGQTGELCVRGYMVMLGYYKQDQKTAEVLGPDRWLKTGDMATMDEEGNVRIVGRSKELIIRGGSNVYPAEIEHVLHKHPAVQDVQVVGVPDERLGEEICAIIRPKPGVEQPSKDSVIEFVKERIARFKAPKYVLFTNEQFPLTASGKAQKFILTQMAVKELGLQNVQMHMDSVNKKK